MGVVWRARDQVLGEEVALKFLPDAVRWDPGAYEDLKGETRRARQLTHPNIVRIHDFVEDSGSAAISMELVEGATLTALRLTRPAKVFSPDEIAAWLPQLCAALDYAHGEARVVHRDLKPANLMLTGDGRLKVADFGVARSMADSITRVSMMSAGTLVYMSPQQAMGEEPSPADDLYALGATLYELLTGKPPFHTGDVRLQLFQRRPDSIAARLCRHRLSGHKIKVNQAAKRVAVWKSRRASSGLL
jgi:serine/threonine protein kinase